MSNRIVYVVVFEPLDLDRVSVGGFDWFDNLREAQKQWRKHDAENSDVNPEHRSRLFEFEVNTLLTYQEITDACELEFMIDDTRMAPLRDTYKVIPNEQLVTTIYNLPGNEGVVYTLRFPKGDEFHIGETQPQYAELAAILDEEWVEPLPMDLATAQRVLLSAELIEKSLADLRAGKGDPYATISLMCDDLRDLVPESLQKLAVADLSNRLDKLEGK